MSNNAVPRFLSAVLRFSIENSPIMSGAVFYAAFVLEKRARKWHLITSCFKIASLWVKMFRVLDT